MQGCTAVASLRHRYASAIASLRLHYAIITPYTTISFQSPMNAFTDQSLPTALYRLPIEFFSCRKITTESSHSSFWICLGREGSHEHSPESSELQPIAPINQSSKSHAHRVCAGCIVVYTTTCQRPGPSPLAKIRSSIKNRITPARMVLLQLTPGSYARLLRQVLTPGSYARFSAAYASLREYE